MTEDNTTQPDTTPENTDTTPDNSGSSELTFTQADLDRIAAKTRAEARQATQKTLLEELGVDSLDSLKTFVTAQREREEAELSEAQQLQKKLDDAAKREQKLLLQLQDMQAAQIATHRASTIKQAIQSAGGQDVDELFILIDALKKDDMATLFDDNNATTDKQMGAFVKQLQADYPRYFASPGAGSLSNAGGVVPSSREEARKKAVKEIDKKHGSL